jgi:hypothetical protein
VANADTPTRRRADRFPLTHGKHRWQQRDFCRPRTKTG